MKFVVLPFYNYLGSIPPYYTVNFIFKNSSISRIKFFFFFNGFISMVKLFKNCNMNIKYWDLSCLYSSEKVNMLKRENFIGETM